MYFPKLTRRSEQAYHNRLNKFYADYKANYDKVTEDCQHRCVYCDILVTEVGGDRMQLDHFRPQAHFNTLSTHPHNLYLSCPRCNVLKSDDWPCTKAPDKPSFIGRIGYLDSFEHDPSLYLKVENTGEITHIAGPINYMIGKMQLNRLSRTQIRRKRYLLDKKEKLSKAITSLTASLLRDVQAKALLNDIKVKAAAIDDIAKRLELIHSLQNKLDGLGT